MSIKVDIISGFLGAGKTTLITKLLQEKLHQEKIVIIENEFGEIGIDGSLLKSTGIEVKEINSGCICCTLSGDFGKAIEEVIHTYKPDRIIIEPSGVGKLSDVVKACETSKLKELLRINMLMTVVDVFKYDLYISNFGEFFENQIKHAKTIILSRTQKSDVKTLEGVVGELRKRNKKANIITTDWETLSAEQIIAVAEQDASTRLENQMSIPKVVIKRPSHKADCGCGHHPHSHHGSGCGCHAGQHNHRADEVFEVWGVETPKTYGEGALRSILHKLGNDKTYGMVLRGKGILQVDKDKWLQFDYVPEEINIKSGNADYTGRLCIIGSQLNKTELAKLFHITP